MDSGDRNVDVHREDDWLGVCDEEKGMMAD